MAEHPDGRALRARRRGLAPGRDRDRRLADRRAPPPPGGADRARRRRGHRLGPLDPGASTCSAACTPAPTHLLRYGGHRAAAGLTIARDRRSTRFREAFVAHAAAVLTPEDLVPRGADRRRRPGRRAVARRSPRSSSSSRRSAWATRRSRCSSPPPTLDRPARDGRGPPRRASRSPPAAPARAACTSAPAARLPVEAGEPADAAVRLEIDRWNGTVVAAAGPAPAPQPCRAAARSSVLGEPERSRDGRARASSTATWRAGRPPATRRAALGAAAAHVRDVRGTGIAGLLGDLVATGEPVLAVTAHAPHRARALRRPRRAASRSRRGPPSRTIPGSPRRSRTSSRSTRPPRPLLDHPSGRGLDPPGLGDA